MVEATLYPRVSKGSRTLVLAGVLLTAMVSMTLAAPSWADAPVRKNSGAVEFELTPKGIVDGRFQFDLTVTTHSIDLSKWNLQANTHLRIGTAVYAPAGPVPLTGHHGKTRIEFPVASVPDVFEIAIRGVPTMNEIVLRWP